MSNYRRVRIKGGTYFFTLVTNKRLQHFHSLEARELFLSSINHVKQFHPFTMLAYCVLLDHVHLLWQMPDNENDYSLRIAEIKKLFSKQFRTRFKINNQANQLQIKRGESGIWQRRFWEHYIRDEMDLSRHMNYIHYNPVKHGLVNRVLDWPSSSFFGYVRSGNYHIDWGESYESDEEKLNFGE